MDTTIIIVSYLAILIASFILLLYLSTKIKLKNYRIDLFGLVITITSKDAAQLLALVFAYVTLNSLLPASFFTLFFVVALLSLGRIRSVDALKTDEKSEQLLSMLSSNQKLIGEVKDHIEYLSKDVQTKQQEIQEKQSIKEKLDQEIQQKSKEANAWQSLTDEQKNLVLDATRSVISKENKNSFWPGMFFGFLINILATIVWTFLGNPGKEQIIEKFLSVSQMFIK